ncbi:MAG: hypothetical protein Q7K11_00420, partial [Candidatus Berkelbacteria bacterium]|nr:hypothetical protein [Candidatus Berkelbacteria bacterium]
MSFNLFYVIPIFVLVLILAYIIFILFLNHKKKREIDVILNTRVFKISLPKEPPAKLEGENG